MRNLAFIALFSAAALWPQGRIEFEPASRAVAPGRSPKLLPRRQHGLNMLTTGPSASGRGFDLFFRSSQDLGDSFAPPITVNNLLGEVSDHGENSPQLLFSPDESEMYAVWNARDPKNPMGSHVRFSKSGAMFPAWSPAITLNDDPSPVSHGFQTFAVAPDGTIYAAWLDMRERGASDSHDHSSHGSAITGGTAAIYMTRSTDRGKTFSKNVRVAGAICPCCRPTIAFAGNRVLIGWRQVEPGDVRDIFFAASSDRGDTWSTPALVGRDGWKIKGCPHVGPAFASLGNRLYAAWFSEGGGDPAIYLAHSTNGGETFLKKQKISVGVSDPTHPAIFAAEDRLAIVFQARDAAKAGGWGKMAVYYLEVSPSGALSKLVRAGEGKLGASYPSVALGLSGRIFIGWTESGPGGAQSYLLRGRSVPSPTAPAKAE
jgi:hypothetical protein